MKKLLIYCTFGGLGHISRASAIIKNIKAKKYMISGVDWKINLQDVVYKKLPEIPGINLLKDYSIKFIYPYKGKEGLKEFREHLYGYVKYLVTLKPNIAIVDLTCEISFFTKFLGFPVVFIYETGLRNDLRHKLAFMNADMILVPYPKGFTDVSYLENEIQRKMFFSGGFSYFDGIKRLPKKNAKKKISFLEKDFIVVIQAGKADYANKFFRTAVRVVGSLKNAKGIVLPRKKTKFTEELSKKYSNVYFFYKSGARMHEYLNAADLAISGTGYNSITELCYFQVPIITVPLKRLYDEQEIKAKNLKKFGAALVVTEKDLSYKKLKNTVEKLIKDSSLQKRMKEKQRKLVDGNGGKRAAKAILKLIK